MPDRSDDCHISRLARPSSDKREERRRREGYKEAESKWGVADSEVPMEPMDGD